MNKLERDEAIEEEASSFVFGSILTSEYLFKKQGYIAGTKSLANIEYIVSRAVEMAREMFHPKFNGYEVGYESCRYNNSEEIITEIAKELGIENE